MYFCLFVWLWTMQFAVMSIMSSGTIDVFEILSSELNVFAIGNVQDHGEDMHTPHAHIWPCSRRVSSATG